MANIGVETTQHVQLNYKPADLSERILAYIVDVFITGIYVVALTLLGESASEAVEPTMGDNSIWVGMLLIFLPTWLYHLVLEVLWNGYTVGKWVMGIRVVKMDGSRPGILAYLLRWFFRVFEITFTSGGLALVTILINGKGQRLGDIAAKTTVIKVKKKTKLTDTVFDEVHDNYEPMFSQAIELTDEDVALINEVIQSQDKYEPAVYIKMLYRMKGVIEQKMGVHNHNLEALQFLQQVKKDYNALHGVL